jgi:hypothetical protein
MKKVLITILIFALSQVAFGSWQEGDCLADGVSNEQKENCF